MTHKIAITGHFRVGKDTFADMLAEALPGPTVRLHFADALKQEVALMVSELLGRWGDSDEVRAEMEADRHLNGLAWQWWGEWRRQKTDLDYWIKMIQAQYREAPGAGSNIIVSDMRHVNEAEWCRSQGFHLVRIVGPCRAEGERRDPNHASESSVDSLPVDSVIPNTGSLNELREAARAFAAFLTG